jgi:hypothetical protein
MIVAHDVENISEIIPQIPESLIIQRVSFSLFIETSLYISLSDDFSI